MNRFAGCCLSSLLLATLLSACGSVNTVTTRTDAPVDRVEHTQVRINDLLTDIFLHCRGLTLHRTSPSGLLEAQIIVANDGYTDRTFGWKLTWLNAAGNPIRSRMNIWEATSVPSGGRVTLSSLAPNRDATDFTFELRRSNNR
jgi:hypothetical protein